jgi:AcrR family transcriptional regulator
MKSTRSYHKGNLRQKLLREAARIIARQGVEAVSMRKLSRRLGISRMAAYHHFEDKDDLLNAVGQDGFRLLAERLKTAARADVPALDALRAALGAYVRFSREETEFFRLMFTNVLKRPVRVNSTAELEPFLFSSPEALAAFEALLRAVKRAQQEGAIGAGEALIVANALWGFAHGVASLVIDNHLKIPCPVDEFLNRGLDALFAGFAAARRDDG